MTAVAAATGRRWSIADRGRQGARSLRANWVTVVLLAGPVVVVLVAAWSRRWIGDDGFINIRVVDQIFAGNGPVFNDGERVEAGSSPAWIFLLVVGRVIFFWLPVEWVAVVLGLAAAATAVVVAEVAALRLWRSSRVMPLGIVAFIALPPVWDFSTSGLETPLCFLWIAASQLWLVSAVRSGRERAALTAAAVIGLGPLVRPDFLVISAVLGIALLLCTRSRSFSLLLKIGGAALAIPGAYEVFRIVYYGALVPNTAFTKEATLSYWGQGRKYLGDFIDPYMLWAPLLLIAALLIVGLRKRTAPEAVLWLAAPLAGLAHAFFVVRGGADQMHGRMLLPALFALLVPLAAVPRRMPYVAVLGLVLVWAVVPIRAGGPDYERIGPDRIADERMLSYASGHPITIDDYRSAGRAAVFLVATGDGAADAAAANERVLMFSGLRFDASLAIPLKDSVPYGAVLAVNSIGKVSVAAGTEVYVADMLGLADPLGARFELERRGWPGHEKQSPVAWVLARYVDPDAELPGIAPPEDVRAARRALQCPELRRLQARASAPFTFSRAARNVLDAFRLHSTRFSFDPAETAASCRRR